MLSQQLTLLLYDAKIQDDTVTLLSLSQERNLKYKYSSNKQVQIEAKYAAEEQQIQNEISKVNLDKKEHINDQDNGGKEVAQRLLTQYEELRGELNEVQDAKDAELKKVEEETTAYEEENELEQTTVQTDLEALKADREAIKENLDQSIETDFSYFQN